MLGRLAVEDYEEPEVKLDLFGGTSWQGRGHNTSIGKIGGML